MEQQDHLEAVVPVERIAGIDALALEILHKRGLVKVAVRVVHHLFRVHGDIGLSLENKHRPP